MTRRAAAAGLGLLVAACAGLVPDAGGGAIVDIPGVGAAQLVFPEPAQQPNDDELFAARWTGARAVLSGEDGQILVAWPGGPAECWTVTSVHFDARGNQLAASVGERPVGKGPCAGERVLWAVLVPGSAVPGRGQVSDWPRP
jgi:hypothetical protein